VSTLIPRMPVLLVPVAGLRWLLLCSCLPR